MSDSNEFFAKCARAQCNNSIRNTAVGRWLGQSLDRLDKAADRIAELEAELEAWQSLDGINWYKRAKELKAENARLKRMIPISRLTSEYDAVTNTQPFAKDLGSSVESEGANDVG